jgi:hypothetical protein
MCSSVLPKHPPVDPRAAQRLVHCVSWRVVEAVLTGASPVLRAHLPFHHPLRRPGYLARSEVVEDVLTGRGAASFKSILRISGGVCSDVVRGVR